jgi:hypothetical protein
MGKIDRKLSPLPTHFVSPTLASFGRPSSMFGKYRIGIFENHFSLLFLNENLKLRPWKSLTPLSNHKSLFLADRGIICREKRKKEKKKEKKKGRGSMSTTIIGFSWTIF